jgi:hypothetical protein
MHLPDPLRMLGEEEFECMKLLWYTLNVIQSIDTDDEFDTLKSALKILYALLHRLLLEVLLGLMST